jgi:hypothetical protein
MPTITVFNRLNGHGVRFDGSHIIAGQIRNFIVCGWRDGVVVASSRNITIKNIVAFEFGDPFEVHYTGGRAIHLNATTGCYVTNCFAMNASGEGISVYHGSSNHIIDCQVYCNENHSNNPTAGIDYYVLIHNARDCTVQNGRIARYSGGNGWPNHVGHGYHVQALDGESYNVVFTNCKATTLVIRL